MAYYFYGTNASQSIYGTSSHDVIYGYGGDDYLWGGFGNDHLYGGSGNDDLVGGSGINTLWGGGGYDWFIMSARSNSSSDDLIADFEFGYDKIDVSAWGVSDFSQIKAILGANAYGDARLNAFAGGYNHVLTVDTVAPYELVASDFIYNLGGAPQPGRHGLRRHHVRLALRRHAERRLWQRRPARRLWQRPPARQLRQRRSEWRRRL